MGIALSSLLVLPLALVPASPLGAPRLQDGPGTLESRITAAQKSIEELRAEVEGLKKKLGGAPPAGSNPAPKRPVEETLPPERRIEYLERAITDLRASVGNLRTDLAMRDSKDALRRDLLGRIPEVQRIQGPVPTAPPAPAPRDEHDHGQVTAIPPTTAPGTPMGIEREVPDLPAGATASGGPDRAILRVNGEEVRKSELDAYVQYLKSYESGAEGLLIRDCIDFALIPMAVVRAHYRDRIPRLHEEMGKLRAEIDGGKPFAEVARRSSEDRVTAVNGGDLGTFGRKEMKLPFARAAFTAEKGAVVGPVETPFGVHLLLVEDVTKGSTPAEDRVRVRHLLLSYDPQNANYWNQINELMDKAVVEVVDPVFQNAVPPRYLRSEK